MLWGQLAWRDAYNPETEEHLRLLTIVNFNGQVLVRFSSREKESRFWEDAEILKNSLRLMEFGP